MPYIDLERRFSKWRDERAPADGFGLFQRQFYGQLSWHELLKHQRVVVLAEAGSGKSKELEERYRELRDAGEYAFHATVLNVATAGLAGALDAAGRARLETWRASDSVGWFFIDSVDEAKLDHIRFVDALRKLGDGLGDGLPRARIVISGRYSDWEFRADLERLNDVLPIASVTDVPASPEEVLAKIVRRDFGLKDRRSPPEKPLVVLMAPLDTDQVRRFAAAQGVKDPDAFMRAIEADNLWHFAKRPLDLGWLVDYWYRNRRFGRFAEILKASIRARLVEPNPNRGSRDELDVERSFLALERLGAAMVFGRVARLEIPDTEVSPEASSGLKLREVLSDWPADQLPKFLTRPVFEPASLGHVRLHNDNEGVVRSFLAARWLKKRLEANASKSRIFDLLFGEADGTPVVLPSAQETAAWLAGLEPDVSQEVIRRDPSLLLTAGDPSSLSLEVRQAALRGVVGELAGGATRHDHLDRATLKRFSTEDLLPAIQEAWTKNSASEEVRQLLLHMIELGGLVGARDIARSAVCGDYADRTTLIFGIRALGITGTTEDLTALAERIKREALHLDDAVVWEALDVLFTRYIDVPQFLEIIGALNKNGDTSEQFGWRGRALVERLTSAKDLKTLLEGLLGFIGQGVDDEERDGDGGETPDEKRLLPLIERASSRLIANLPTRQHEDVVVDAAVRLADRRIGARRFEDESFLPALLASPERRRQGLWRAVERLKDDARLKPHGLTNLSQLESVGWYAGLDTKDIPWLLEDVGQSDDLLKQRLALRGLMPLWRDGGESEVLLEKITRAADATPEGTALLKAWLSPPEESAAEVEHKRRLARLMTKHAAVEQEQLRWWSDLVDRLKSDPEQLRTLPSTLQPGQNGGPLVAVYKLLSASTERTAYSISEFGALADVLGARVTLEATDALIRFWKVHKPTLVSSRRADARNEMSLFDAMAIAGVSLEARRDMKWAEGISAEEATTAAQLATLELNGFPLWLAALVKVWPGEVRTVLVQEAQDHLTVAPEHHAILDKIAYAEPELVELVAPFLVTHVLDSPDMTEAALAKVFAAIGKALPKMVAPPALGVEALRRFASSDDLAVAAHCIGFVFRIDPKAGVIALTAKLDSLRPGEQKAVAEHVLPAIFGDRWFSGRVHPKMLPFDVLERLVRIAFRTIRREDDVVHVGAYTPGARDRAEGVRGTLFNQLVETPGRDTLEALRRMAADPDRPISKARLAELIHERASKDAEHAPWAPGEALELETEFDVAPRTPRDLQLVAVGRLEDLAHDLHHHRFAQGQTFKTLLNEREVQKWLAWEMERRGGRAFTLEREPHVVDEKEPDIRLQSRVTDASLPIEVKVADSWSIKDLEEAITTQLAVRYLRERDTRHGVLVLVHQNARPKGWSDETGAFLSFAQVVERLRALADSLGVGDDAARVEIAAIDVSEIEVAPASGKKTDRSKPPMKANRARARRKAV